MSLKLKIAVPKPRPKPILPADTASDVLLVVEKFPRIGDKIILMWGSVELQKYFIDLIVDERGDRQGFPPQIGSALMRIYREHTKLFPDKDNNAWNSVIY